MTPTHSIGVFFSPDGLVGTIANDIMTPDNAIRTQVKRAPDILVLLYYSIRFFYTILIMDLYRILLCWTTAFAVMEPFVSLFHIYFNKDSKHRNSYQKYFKTHVLLIVVAEYIYFTSTLLHTMLVYHYIFGKKDYFPEKWVKKDVIDFAIAYAITSAVYDVVWTLAMSYIGKTFPVLKFVKNYSHGLGVQAILRPMAYGLSLSAGTMLVNRYVPDMECFSIIFLSVFLLVISQFN